MMKKFMLLTSISLLLISCNKAKDVEYYLKHPEERQTKLDECLKNLAEASKDKECKNAGIALNKSMFNSNNTKMPQIK
jgi:hypothetical protein